MNVTLVAQRNEEGIVQMPSEHGVLTAKIPQDRSMIGMIGINGIINNGEYREDGWVYLGGQPVRKWHSRVESYRLWEPKLNDLPALYDLHKRTQAANNEAWRRIQVVIDKLWGKHKQGDTVKAHAFPKYHIGLPGNVGIKEDYWEFNINNYYGEGVSFGFNWVVRPKRLSNPQLGQELYELERRWWDNTCRRAAKVRTVFYEAMKQSLPKATENQVICLQFGEDTFWFYVVMHNNYPVWNMFNDQYRFEVKRIV